MIARITAILFVSFALTLPTMAQFGPKEPTPKTTQERYAERAIANALSFSEVSPKTVVTSDDGIDPERMQFWFDEARDVYQSYCDDRASAKDLWARNCFNLADMYRRGVGVRQDYALATDLYLAACEQGGHVDACLAQAYIDHSGNGGEQNWARARMLYDGACTEGSWVGCAGLGNMLYRGQGGMADRPRGARLLRQACTNEYAWACERLEGFGITEVRSPF